MSIHRKLTTVCCAAVLALGLAACGSSDDAKKMDMDAKTMGMNGDDGPGGMAVMLASLQAGTEVSAGTHTITGDEDALTALYTALVAFASTVPADGYAPGSEAVSVGGLMLMCSARSTVNCNLSIDEDAQTITVTGLILVAADDGMFPDDRTDEQKMAAGTAATAAATKAAGTKATAIKAEADQAAEADAGLGGDAASEIDADALGYYTLSIKHGETSITVEGATDDADVKFTQARDFEDGRTMHTRTMEAGEDGDVMQEIAIVYTDIEAPTATAFAVAHAADLDANPKTEGGQDFQSVAVDADNLAMVATSGITSIGAGPITVPRAVDDNDETPDVDETVAAFETDATFNGAPGKLKCAGTNSDCTVTLDGDGKITVFGDDWQFTPADDATVDVADADYLHYGFWPQKTTDADGADTYDEVQTFAGSSVAQSDGVADVKGTANYEGGAVGVYVKHVYNPDRTIASSTSGHFKADASLMAYFGGEDVPASKQNSVTGTIDEFVLQHGEANTWTVALDGTIASNGFSGTSKGHEDDTGMFSGTFHGDVTAVDHDMDGTTDDVSPTPSSVVGEFNANFSNGSAAGGFGARETE